MQTFVKVRFNDVVVRGSLGSHTVLQRLLAAVLIVSAATTSSAQKAVFSGTILADSSEKPIPNAEIVFTDLKRAVRTDTDGNFKFSDLPVGKHVVTVRVVGFRPVTSEVTLVDGKPLDVEMILKRTSTVLENVEVKAAASPWERQLRDFEGRRKTGAGKYLTEADLQKEDGQPLSAFIQGKIAGLKILSLNTERFLTSARGMGLSGLKAPRRTNNNFKKYPVGCYMQVIVDRRVEFSGLAEQEPFDIDRLNTREIIGIEYYTTATTPVQFSATLGENSKSCGTVVIWTKGG